MRIEQTLGPNNPEVKKLAEQAADLSDVPEIDINMSVSNI